MKLSGSQFKNIQSSLLSGFSSKDQLAIMVRFQLDENLDSIAGGDNLNVVVFNLIRWAESTGKVKMLIKGAAEYNPGNASLNQLVADADKWIQTPNRFREQEPELIYDSFDDHKLGRWTVHSSVSNFEERLTTYKRKNDGTIVFDQKVYSTESVGFNRSLPMLYGKIEFDYNIIHSGGMEPNVYCCMIPMQETGIRRTGLIEVGSNIQGDPKNPYSKYRQRLYLPMKHYGDGQWHSARMAFDFRKTPAAFYTIFASRINEGVDQPAAARLLIANIKAYSLS